MQGIAYKQLATLNPFVSTPPLMELKQKQCLSVT
jgi:hypothetical protein